MLKIWIWIRLVPVFLGFVSPGRYLSAICSRCNQRWGWSTWLDSYAGYPIGGGHYFGHHMDVYSCVRFVDPVLVWIWYKWFWDRVQSIISRLCENILYPGYSGLVMSVWVSYHSHSAYKSRTYKSRTNVGTLRHKVKQKLFEIRYWGQAIYSQFRYMYGVILDLLPGSNLWPLAPGALPLGHQLTRFGIGDRQFILFIHSLDICMRKLSPEEYMCLKWSYGERN